MGKWLHSWQHRWLLLWSSSSLTHTSRRGSFSPGAMAGRGRNRMSMVVHGARQLTGRNDSQVS